MDSSTPPHHHPSNPTPPPSLSATQQHPLPLPVSLGTTTTPTQSSPLLLSPSPLRKSRASLADRLEMAAAAEDPAEPSVKRRRCKTRGSQMGAAVASPRNARKPRRPRSEVEIREDNKDMGLVEEVGKPRKRRNSGRPRKEKLNLPHSVLQPSTSSLAPNTEEEDGIDLDRIGQLVSDLVMWKDVSKSTFWFGSGSMGLLSSCFNFSIFSALSQLGILILGVSVLSNLICQRNRVEEKREIKLREDDILRLAKLILPALNLVISKTRVLFSGEPSMTLKVLPFLLLGAKYGHFITIWRLCVIGFLVSFSVPKLCSYYTTQIDQRAECLKLWLLDKWFACTHKKKLMATAFFIFGKLPSVKIQIFTAFILLVLFRYLNQHVVQLQEGEAQAGEKEQEQEPMVTETEEKEAQHALVLREQQQCQN